MAQEQQGAVIDQVFFALGWWGRYTQVQFVMVMLPVIVYAVHMMSFVFIGRAVDHQCAPVDSLNISFGEHENYDVVLNAHGLNLSLVYGKCNIEVKNGTDILYSAGCLNGYLYAEPIERSFVSEWDLVCESEAVSDISQTLLSLGMGCGALVFTALADRYGRKPMYMLPHFLMFIVAIAIAFVPDTTSFLVLRFFLGALQQGMGLVGSILVIEIIPTPRRALPVQIGNFVWIVGLLLTGLIAYVMKNYDWRYTEVCYAALSFFVLFQWWVTDESLRWLAVNNKEKEVERVLRKAAKTNGVGYNQVVKLLKTDTSEKETPMDKLIHFDTPETRQKKKQSDGREVQLQQGDSNLCDEREKTGFLAFVRHRHLLKVSICSCYMWFTDSVAYYGLLMTSFTDDLYLGFLLNVAVELPAYITFLPLVNRFDRKRCLSGFHLLAAVTLILAVLLSNAGFAESIPGRHAMALVVSLVGRYAVAVGFAFLWLYSPELFPTNVRNLGFGISSLSARIGGMIVPFSRTFGRKIPWGPGAVFASLCLMVPVVLRYLPETKGEELPQTLDDMDRWFNQDSRRKKAKDGEIVQA